MCNENRNEIFQINYSQQSDAPFWQTNASSVPDIVNERLRLIPDDATTFFERELGNIDSSNNRLKIGFDMEIFRPVGSTDSSSDIVFQIMQGNDVIGTGTVCVENIESSQKASFHLDRTFSYSNLSGSIKVRINIPNGFQNILDLKDIKIEDFNFCDDNLRMYFIFQDFFEASRQAVTGLLRLNTYKIGGNETLTQEFFNETANLQIEPDQWLFADSDIDGDNRVRDDDTPKSFNPFHKALLLDFVNPVPYYGGKPTGTINGSDYGPGVLNLGFGKPKVLNELLEFLPGAFFIDIDFTQDLSIQFDLVISNVQGSVFDNPSYYRTFNINFSVEKCEATFYYLDRLRNNINVDQIHNGFLYGITGQEIESRTVQCDESINYQGDEGTYEFFIDFGQDTGLAGINYNSQGIPDKFSIEWNGQIFTSGFVGDDDYDQQLINAGVPSSDINTGPGTAIGILSFNKDQELPTQALVRVEAPLPGTGWNLSGRCPEVNQNTPIEIGFGSCDNLPSEWFEVYHSTQVSASNYVPANGDVIYEDVDLTTPYNGAQKTFRMRVPTEPFPTVLAITFKIDENGVVNGIRLCSIIGNEDVIFINSTIVSDCQTCWVLEMDIPENETRTVEFQGTFAPAGQYAVGCITEPGAIYVDSDGIVNNVADGTIFVVGIDGAQPAPFGSPQSTISVVVKNGTDVVDAVNLTRVHINQNC